MKIAISAWRKNAGLTQEGLAALMGYERKKVMNWENGKTRPSVPDMEMMAKIFNTSVDSIFIPAKSTN